MSSFFEKRLTKCLNEANIWHAIKINENTFKKTLKLKRKLKAKNYWNVLLLNQYKIER